MNKYKIGLLIFINCIQLLHATDNAEIFDYVSSRDEIAVLSMIEADFDVFNSLGLVVVDKNVLGWPGQMYNIKVVRNNECTIGAIFYTSFLDFNYPCWEICFLVVNELYRNQGYGSLMIKSVINEIKESTGDGVCRIAPLAGLCLCSGLEDDFDVLKFLSDLNYDTTDESQYIIYLDLSLDAIFSQACRKLDIERIKKCIAQGIDINKEYLFKDVRYYASIMPWELKSPLRFAIENNNYELAEILINAGANVTGICYKTTPLRIAIKHHNLDMFLLLIQAGCDINELSYYDDSLLLPLITYFKNIEIEKILIKVDTHANLKPHFGLSLLKYAIMENCPEFILILLQDCYYLDQDFGMMTPLHRAVYNTYDLIVFDALLSAGLNINAVDINGLTALDLVEKILNEKYTKFFSSNQLNQLEKIKEYLLLHTY